MTQPEFSQPEHERSSNSPMLPRLDAELLHDSYITAFAGIGEEQSRMPVAMHFMTLEGDHIEVTRVPELREIQTAPCIALTALRRTLYRKLGRHPSTYDAHLYSLTATSAGSDESIMLFTPIGPTHVRGRRREKASARFVNVVGEELISVAKSIQEKIIKSPVCLTDEQWQETKLMGPLTEVCGPEAKMLQKALTPVRDALLARDDQEFTILKGGKYAMVIGVLNDRSERKDLPVYAVTVIRPQNGRGYQSTRVLFDAYPFDRDVSEDSKLVVTAATILGRDPVVVNYSRVYYDADGIRREEFAPLDKVCRMHILESIQQQVTLENLRD